MPRLIFKCPYIKGGSGRAASHLNNYVSYMATRPGAERVEDQRPATKKQREIAQTLAGEFPLCRGMREYRDHQASPTRANASAFISRALEENGDEMAKKENYLRYIARRPRVQMVGTHGLFTGTGETLVLSKVAAEVAKHPGSVWLPIISLRREDAARLGYDNAESWQALLSANAMRIAEAMKIPTEQFRWYAAFHDEGHHPHVHMVCYSADGRSGYLTPKGIETIRSGLARQIFRQELTEIYAGQTRRRDDLTAESRAVLKDLCRQMDSGEWENERIREQMLRLALELRQVKGKKKYGYLKAPLKTLVDEITDELGKDPRVAQAYSLWYDLREEVLRTYRDTMPERTALSQQREFRQIKNLVVEEAVRLGERLAAQEDGQMEAEQDAVVQTEAETGTSQSGAPPHAPPHIPLPYAPPDVPNPQPVRSGPAYDALVLQSVARLLHHMGRIFREQTPAPPGGLVTRVDSKLRRKIQEKKMAQGHKADDHAPEMNM